MSVESPEVRGSVELHPLYRSLKQRCLVVVDENGEALMRNKKMKTEGLPDLAIVYVTGERSEDSNVGSENCRQFVEWAATLLALRDEKRQFTYDDPYLLMEGVLLNWIVIKNLEPIHVEKLMLAYNDPFVPSGHVELVFARLQIPQLRNEVYDDFYSGVTIPQHGTSARTILDRVTLMKNLDLVDFDNADRILYTGGDFPVPYAYNQMEVLAGNSDIEIIRPYQLVYGLQTGALIRATNPQREERAADLDAFIEKCKNLEGCVGKDSVSQDIFCFKSRT